MFQPVIGGQPLGIGLDQDHDDRLGVLRYLNAQQVVDVFRGAAPDLASDEIAGRAVHPPRDLCLRSATGI